MHLYKYFSFFNYWFKAYKSNFDLNWNSPATSALNYQKQKNTNIIANHFNIGWGYDKLTPKTKFRNYSLQKGSIINYECQEEKKNQKKKKIIVPDSQIFKSADLITVVKSKTNIIRLPPGGKSEIKL